jgi:2-dehydro-3-deoxygalactonokinase
MSTAQLIALDWGTSNLRASLLDASGHTLDHRSAPGGVMAVQGGHFAQALLALCADWLQEHSCPVIASGMVGSRQGWKEAPYLDCPASVAQAAQALVTVPITGERLLHIAPGLRCQEPSGVWDVMRGEETQIWGAGVAPGSCCVLPGTHSKWAWTGAQGEVLRFATYMTGELYGLLTQHGILGRLMVQGHARPADFEAGVRQGLAGHAQTSHLIFAARTAGLMGTVAPEGLPDYLSGMLIGVEIAGATLAGRPQQVVIIGDEALSQRYARALALAGIASVRAGERATTLGQCLIARAAGLLGARP